MVKYLPTAPTGSELYRIWDRLEPGEVVGGWCQEGKPPPTVTEWALHTGHELQVDLGTWTMERRDDGIPDTVREYVDRLDAGQHWLQGGIGDGEFACMLQERPAGDRNSQGEAYWPDLGLALRETLTDPRGVWVAACVGAKLEERWQAERARNGWPGPWVGKNILIHANCTGQLGPFIAALRRRRVCLVGPRHLDNCSALPEPAGRVVVPDSTAWLELDRIEAEVRGAVAGGCDFVSLSVGMPAIVLARRCADMVDRATVHDMGAVWDPFSGVWSRKRYKRDDFPKIVEANLRGAEA